MERNLKTTILSHVIGYQNGTNQEQQGSNQTALIKGEIKCRKWKGKQQRTDCTEWNRKHKQETQKWKKMEDGKSDLCGCRPREDLHATWRVVAPRWVVVPPLESPKSSQDETKERRRVKTHNFL